MKCDVIYGFVYNTQTKHLSETDVEHFPPNYSLLDHLQHITYGII